MPPALLFLLGIALALWGLLWFRIHIRIVFFFFCEKCHWNFERDYSDSIDQYGQNGHFNNINFFNP